MAPDQKQAAERWAEGARDALDTAQKLFASKKYHHALFFCHLAVEKALKSAFIAEHNKLPPYTHDLLLLTSRLSGSLEVTYRKELKEINTFNVSARYQEQKLDLYHRATQTYASKWFKICIAIAQEVLKTL